MNDDWNDELRRAYDRGYWDARREMQRMNERQDGGGRSGSRGEDWRESQGEGGGRTMNSGSESQERGWTPEWSKERRQQMQGDWRSGDGSVRGRDDDRRRPWGRGDDASDQRMGGGDENSWRRSERGGDEGSYRQSWRERDSGYERGWDRRESSPGLRESDYDSSGFGSAEDRWTGRTVNDTVGNSRRAGADQDYHPGHRRDLDQMRDRDRRDRTDRDEWRDRDRNRGDGDRDNDRRDERGFFERAGDEIRSWFDDDDNNRRRR